MQENKASSFDREQLEKMLSEIDPWSCFEAGMMMFTEDIFADGRTPVTETVRDSL